MTISLAQIQKNFAQALFYQTGAEGCEIVSDHFSADRRIQIYRNNFVVSLSEILELTYPLVKALVGDQCFAGLARSHVLSNPLSQGSVSNYGDRFEKTIVAARNVINTVPYLADIARLEHAIDFSNRIASDDSCSNEVFPLEQLSQLDENQQGDIRLILHPSVILLCSEFAIFSIREGIVGNRFDGIDIYSEEQGFVCHPQTGQLFVQTLTEAEFTLLSCIEQQGSLNSIPERLLGQLPNLLQYPLIAGFTINQIEG
ncbi:DNA-binding domain-containing protein [Vibrio sp. JC009]|uniref:HvfC/BufC N-terminal domain-containing protein n=1 Tax=Vibrio sp. JC009 TaxID=2912314 RepID=UPI0023AEA86A|nr:DNA-binding domain-containing protein [Vibrio sp. JC009]WED21796.1 DNA-binding domain-containing protein [Vibrio sp. JC009]